jgi:hypothetical protein
MDDVDVFLAREVGDPHRTQNAERVSNGDLKNVLLGYERQPVTPIARRAECNKDLMSARDEVPAKIDDMTFGTGVMLRR